VAGEVGSNVGSGDAAAGDAGASLTARLWQVAVHDGYRVRTRGIEFSIKVRYPRGATGPLPLVVLPHGGLSNVRGHEELPGWGEAFAAAGYVAIPIAHAGADSITAMCAALRVPSTECELTDSMSEVAMGCSLPPPLDDRPLDARAVLDDLTRVSRHREDTAHHGKQGARRDAGNAFVCSPVCVPPGIPAEILGEGLQPLSRPA